MHDALISVASAFSNVSMPWITLAVVFHLANMMIRSLVWREVLRLSWPAEQISVRNVARAYCVGVACNAVMPARGGDVIKVGMIRRTIAGAEIASVAATMGAMSLVDMVIGMFVLCVILMSGTATLPIAASDLMAGRHAEPIVLAFGGAVTMLALTIIAHTASSRARRAAHRIRGAIARGIHGLRSPREYVQRVVPIHVAAWTARIATVFCMAHAFHLPATVAIAAAAVAAHGVASLVPVPGGLGAQQAVHIAIFSGLSSVSQVLSFSVASQVVTSTINVVIGTAILMVMIGTVRPRTAWQAMARSARST